MLEHKAVPVGPVTVLDRENGIVSAIVSVTGIVDRVKDVIVPGAYTKTLQARLPKGVWHHDMTKPVSKTLEIKELLPGDAGLPTHLADGTPWPPEAGALKVKTQFNLGTQRGRDAFADVEFFGSDQEWSIGYRVPTGESEMKGGNRWCYEIDLFEYSPVLFGAMPHARTITSVKDAQESWAEVKSAIFGTCADGEGTCCLSCGTKAAGDLESKSDVGAERWVATLADEAVGTFATKTQAEHWMEAFGVEGVATPAEDDEDDDDDSEIERFITAFHNTVMEFVSDETNWVDLDEKRLSWREAAHKRGPNGRFIAKLGAAMRETRAAARQSGTDVASFVNHREDSPSLRQAKAQRSAARATRIAMAVDLQMAETFKRKPSPAGARLLGNLYGASRHLMPGDDRRSLVAKDALISDTRQAAFDWAGDNDKKYRRLMKILPKAVDFIFDIPTLRDEGSLPVRRPRSTSPWVDANVVKSESDELETKRYNSGWDPDQPRDGSGRWTDTAGEAAMKQAIQKMASGAESAEEALSRLKMDQGDADLIAQAHFNENAGVSTLDPKAPQVLSGSAADNTLQITDPAHLPTLEDAISRGLVNNIQAQVAAPQLGIRGVKGSEARSSMSVLVDSLGRAGGMPNPEDRLAVGTSIVGGEDLARAYDETMEALVAVKGKKKKKAALSYAGAIQTEMIAVFGQDWRKRIAPLKGPNTLDDIQAEEKARVKSERRNLALIGLLYGAIGAAVVGANIATKADEKPEPKADEKPEPGKKPDPAEKPDPAQGRPALDAEAANEVVNGLVGTESSRAAVREFTIRPPKETEDDFSVASVLHALATIPELTLEDGEEAEPEVEEEAEPKAEEEVETDAEEEDETKPDKKKAWAAVDEVLDFYSPEEAFEGDPEIKADDDPDIEGHEALSDEAIEEFLDEFYQSIFGDSATEDVEEKRASFNPDLHPRGNDGKFARRGAGGKVLRAARTYARGTQYLNMAIPGRNKMADRRYKKSAPAMWRRERVAAVLQDRKPSRQVAKLSQAGFGAAILPPNERQAYLDRNDIDINDLMRSARRDIRQGGASPEMAARVDRNLTAYEDLFFRTEKSFEEVDFEMKGLLIDAEIAEWTAEHVFDLMAKMSPDELEELIDAVEEIKAAPVAELTGGKIGEPGKGNKGNIRPIIRWFERGEGAARIRWGTSGDFMRCVRLAGKHMTLDNAKGFCNKRHVAVLGNAPGQGPHAGKGFTAEELEAKCVLCFGDIGTDQVCTGCSLDWSTKSGIRHFVESLVRRDEDGQFAPKLFGKRKKTLKRRAATAAVKKGAIPTAMFALGHRGGKRKGVAEAAKVAAGNPGPSAVKNRGKADSWVDTIDALADMAGDPDSLLNHMVDVGMARHKAGVPIVNFSVKDRITGARMAMKGGFDAGKIRAGAMAARRIHRENLGYLDRGESHRAIETVIDLDASEIHLMQDNKVSRRALPATTWNGKIPLPESFDGEKSDKTTLTAEELETLNLTFKLYSMFT